MNKLHEVKQFYIEINIYIYIYLFVFCGGTFEFE